MNFLPPKLLSMLPGSTLGLLAYVSLLAGECAHSKAKGGEGWISLAQDRAAKRLGRDARSVKRYERALRDVGLIEVAHRQYGNRRSVRLRELDDLLHLVGNGKALPPLRRWTKEWGHACPHSGDTRVPTPPAASVSPKRRTLSKNPQPPVCEASTHARGRGGEQAPHRKLGLGPEARKAMDDFAEVLGVWRRAKPELQGLAALLSHELGDRGAAEALNWARAKAREDGTRNSQGARGLGLLRSRVSKLQERTTPRQGLGRL